MNAYPLRVRLSVLMFLHYFSAGITLPIMSLYLGQELGFGGAGAGLILSMSALSALVAPLAGAFLADRIISAERLFALTEIAAGLFMLCLWLSTSYVAILLFYLLYMSMLIPAMALSNAIVLHYSPDGGSSFGGIRVWGTAGWVAAGWAFSYFWIGLRGGAVADAPLFTAMAAAALGLFAFLLPAGAGAVPRRQELIPRAALRILVRPEVALVVLAALLMQVTHRTYYFGAAPYLRHLGFSDRAILPALSIGQITEVLSMLALPFLFRRFTCRTVLLMGATFELIRFSWLYFGTTPATAILGIVSHGPAYALFFTVAIIYLNSHADGESRAGIQQLFLVVTESLGALTGNILAGVLYDSFSRGALVDYALFWRVPMILAVVSIVVLLRARLTSG